MSFGLKRVSEEKKTGLTFRGREIILSKARGRPFTGLLAMGLKKGMYPEKTRVEAAAIFAITGSVQKTAELAKVTESTVRTWKSEDWFQKLVAEVHAENNEKVDAKFTQIIEKAQDSLIDRLDNGDFHVLKTGEVIRKPIAARDLSLVAAINIDKRQLLRGLPTSRTESVGLAGTKLEKLADAFIQLANKRRPRVIDAEVVSDNQEDQRRLQGSVGEIRTESRGSEDLGGSQETTGPSRILQTEG